MVTRSPATRPAERSRRRRVPGWVPNQHGAWAMLIAPFLVGVLAGGPSWVQIPLAAFWIGGYFAFFAVTLWLKSRRRRSYLAPVRVYTLLSIGLGLVVLVMRPDLARWAGFFVVPMVIALWYAARRRDRDLVPGLVMIAASAAMVVVAFDAGGGTDLRRAGWLALVQFAYFGGTVFVVKTLIRERGSTTYRALSIGWHVAAALLTAALSWWLAAVFVVLTARAALVPRLRPTPKQLGISEVAATVVVAATSLIVV